MGDDFVGLIMMASLFILVLGAACSMVISAYAGNQCF